MKLVRRIFRAQVLYLRQETLKMLRLQHSDTNSLALKWELDVFLRLIMSISI
jgi:hypothetical protein